MSDLAHSACPDTSLLDAPPGAGAGPPCLGAVFCPSYSLFCPSYSVFRASQQPPGACRRLYLDPLWPAITASSPPVALSAFVGPLYFPL